MKNSSYANLRPGDVLGRDTVLWTGEMTVRNRCHSVLHQPRACLIASPSGVRTKLRIYTLGKWRSLSDSPWIAYEEGGPHAHIIALAAKGGAIIPGYRIAVGMYYTAVENSRMSGYQLLRRGDECACASIHYENGVASILLCADSVPAETREAFRKVTTVLHNTV